MLFHHLAPKHAVVLQDSRHELPEFTFTPNFLRDDLTAGSGFSDSLFCDSSIRTKEFLKTAAPGSALFTGVTAAAEFGVLLQTDEDGKLQTQTSLKLQVLKPGCESHVVLEGMLTGDPEAAQMNHLHLC